MKGYRFYLEYESKWDKEKATVKNPGNHQGNVLAVVIGTNAALGAVNYNRNAFVCTITFSQEYLRDHCKRIPERLAREIHPRLFSVL